LNLKSRIVGDEQFALKAITEREYYADQAVAGIAIKFVGQIIALFLTVGAMFAVANTMFGAVASRAREIGTLRALGFSRSSVMAGFLLESTIMALVGGAIGCLGTWPVNGLSTGTANWVTFSELTFSFRFGTAVLIQGALLAMLMGLVGGLLPALRAVRLKVVDALREV
jgi:putative ABC transport system permease protein